MIQQEGTNKHYEFTTEVPQKIDITMSPRAIFEGRKVSYTDHD